MAKKPVAKKAPVKQVAKKATPRESKARDYPRAHANGRHAAKRGIPKDQAPVFFNDDERKAWLEGYDSLG